MFVTGLQACHSTLKVFYLAFTRWSVLTTSLPVKQRQFRAASCNNNPLQKHQACGDLPTSRIYTAVVSRNVKPVCSDVPTARIHTASRNVRPEASSFLIQKKTFPGRGRPFYFRYHDSFKDMKRTLSSSLPPSPDGGEHTNASHHLLKQARIAKEEQPWNSTNNLRPVHPSSLSTSSSSSSQTRYKEVAHQSYKELKSHERKIRIEKMHVKSRTLELAENTSLTAQDSTWHLAQSVEEQTEPEEGELVSSTSSLSTESESLDINFLKTSYSKLLLNLPRQWEYTSYGHYLQNTGAKQGFEFSLMTYNILAQDYIDIHRYLYSACKKKYLKWERRQELLIAEIAYHLPDVLNLQEVQSEHYHSGLLQSLEKLGYKGIYQKCTGDKIDGCATLWLDSKFKLLRSTPVQYYRGGLLDRDNVAIIVELQPRRLSSQAVPEEDKIVIANTHILFNPRRGDVKLGQLMVLLAEIDKCISAGSKEANVNNPQQLQRVPGSKLSDSDHSNSSAQEGKRSKCCCPVIVVGDFNMEPYCDLYNFMISGQLRYNGQLCRLLSGQKEGSWGGSSQTLEPNFFSPMYGITDQCRYHSHVELSRSDCHTDSGFPGKTADSSESHSLSLSYFINNLKNDTEKCSESNNQDSLYLKHNLNLISAYRHTIERLHHSAKEVSTRHSQAQCNVDYIFYSGYYKRLKFHKGRPILRDVPEGNLRLLARYGLMSARELDSLGGIPNYVVPSDHLCLLAKFILL